MSDQSTYDAIVVGSGITGGWAAKELTEKGFKTLVLEAGRPIVPEEDYVEHVPSWEMKFRGMGDRRRLRKTSPSRALATPVMSGHQSFSSATRSIRTPPRRASLSAGFADARSVAARSPGDAKATAGAISTSKPTYVTA